MDFCYNSFIYTLYSYYNRSIGISVTSPMLWKSIQLRSRIIRIILRLLTSHKVKSIIHSHTWIRMVLRILFVQCDYKSIHVLYVHAYIPTYIWNKYLVHRVIIQWSFFQKWPLKESNTNKHKHELKLKRADQIRTLVLLAC